MVEQIAELATAKANADLNTAVGVSLLKKAQDIGAEGALQLLQELPIAPSTGGVGGMVDVSV